MAVESALAGQGILMGYQALVATELESGRLVAPFDIQAPVRHRYIALYAERDVAKPQVEAFLTWLQTEID